MKIVEVIKVVICLTLLIGKKNVLAEGQQYHYNSGTNQQPCFFFFDHISSHVCSVLLLDIDPVIMHSVVRSLE